MTARKRRRSEVENLRQGHLPTTSDVVLMRARARYLNKADMAVSRELGTSRRRPSTRGKLAASRMFSSKLSMHSEDRDGSTRNSLDNPLSRDGSPKCRSATSHWPAHRCGKVFIDPQGDRIYCTRCQAARILDAR